MTVAAQSIIEGVAKDLGDQSSVHWTIDELCTWLNDFQNDAVSARPDLTSTRTSHALSAGTKQTLPAGAIGLLDIERNTSGNKKAVTKVERNLLDRHLPGWHGQAGKTEILHYCYDPREPLVFLSYPPAAAGASLEIVYTAKPTAINVVAAGGTYADVTGNLALPDWTETAAKSYIKARAYSKDGEATANPGLAQAFLKEYAVALGIQITSKLAAAPASTS